MTDTIIVHAYKASGPERTYTFLFDSDPGQNAVEEMLIRYEGDIWIADRFPLMMGNVLAALEGRSTDNIYDYDLTLFGGEIIPAGTPIIFKTHTDILWAPADKEEADYDVGMEN